MAEGEDRNWYSPNRDFMNYGKRLKNTYRYFGYQIITSLIQSFAKQDKEFGMIPIHIYEVRDTTNMNNICGYLPGQFVSMLNLNEIKNIGGDKNGIKTLLLVNIGIMVTYFYKQFLVIKSSGVNIREYIENTKIDFSNPYNTKMPDIRYANQVEYLFNNFNKMVMESSNMCANSIYKNEEKIEKLYNFKLVEEFLPEPTITDIISYTQSLIDDIEGRIEDEHDIVE